MVWIKAVLGVEGGGWVIRQFESGCDSVVTKDVYVVGFMVRGCS